MSRIFVGIVLVAPVLAFLLVASGAGYALLMGAGLPRLAASLVRDPLLRGQALYGAGDWQGAVDALAAAGPRNRYNLATALARAGRLRDALNAFDLALDRDPDDDDAGFNRALVAQMLDAAAAKKDGAIRGSANATAIEKRHGIGGPDSGGEAQQSSGNGFAGGQEAQSSANSKGGSKVDKRAAGDKASSESGQGQAYGSAADSEGRGHRGGSSASVAEQVEAQRRRIDKSWEYQSVQPTRQWLETLPDEEGRYLKLRLAAEHARRHENDLNIGQQTGGDEE